MADRVGRGARYDGHVIRENAILPLLSGSVAGLVADNAAAVDSTLSLLGLTERWGYGGREPGDAQARSTTTRQTVMFSRSARRRVAQSCAATSGPCTGLEHTVGSGTLSFLPPSHNHGPYQNRQSTRVICGREGRFAAEGVFATERRFRAPTPSLRGKNSIGSKSSLRGISLASLTEKITLTPNKTAKEARLLEERATCLSGPAVGLEPTNSCTPLQAINESRGKVSQGTAFSRYNRLSGALASLYDGYLTICCIQNRALSKITLALVRFWIVNAYPEPSLGHIYVLGYAETIQNRVCWRVGLVVMTNASPRYGNGRQEGSRSRPMFA
ncbi:hypothetical protein Bbelb_279410 [Branchiostoma belcheri]|nr:hypothetical protein Bbelb_279410 [Branchiostoma belcheri]